MEYRVCFSSLMDDCIVPGSMCVWALARISAHNLRHQHLSGKGTQALAVGETGQQAEDVGVLF